MADLPTITWTSGAPDSGQSGTVMTVSNITDRIGEVQASPTANTLLDRVKTLNSSLTDGSQHTMLVDNSDTEIVFEPSVAHDAADSGNPTKIGMKAIAHGANPTAVAANDRTNWFANRHGIPWVIGGHPNVVTKAATIDAGDGAQTDASLLTVSAGTKIVVTQISAKCGNAVTTNVAVRIGFATSTLGAASEAGTTGILLEGKFGPGQGHQIGNGAGIIGTGADNEDLRITCDAPTGGSLFVSFSYYTIES